MKKVLLIVLVVALGAAGLVAYGGYRILKTNGGCVSNCDNDYGSGSGNYGNGNGGGTTVRGSGKIKTETRAPGPFTSIHLAGVGNAVVERTGATGLSVSGDDNLLAFVVSEVKGGTLYLSIKDRTSIDAAHLDYRVTVADLREIDVSGSANLKADNLDGAALAVKVSGAGRVRLSGRTDDFTVAVSGAGSLDAGALNAKRATIAVDGAGSAIVNAGDALDATASGAGKVRYVGAPKLTTHISGAGSVAELRQ